MCCILCCSIKVLRKADICTTHWSMDQEALHYSIRQVVEMSDDDLVLLMSCVRHQFLKKGEAVLQEGEVCRSFYFVEKGHLRTYYDKEGTIINLHFTFENDFTSNLKSFRDRSPSELVIEAGEEAAVWIFNIRQLAIQLGDHPQISRFVRRLALRLLLASEEHSKLFKIYNATERYHYIEKHQPQLLQRISLSQLSSYLGVTRETLSRIRGKRS